jgi:putative GTP pyrophosphokinase
MVDPPDKTELAIVEPLVAHYVEHKNLVSSFLNSMLVYIEESIELKKFAHSIRSRLKDPDHLRDKLTRKLRTAKEEGAAFDITTANLFVKINDLAGIRILHLHTTQMEEINKCIKAIIAEQTVKLVEGPAART